MKKFFLLALLVLSASANAATSMSDDERKTDVVLSENEDGKLTMHLGIGFNAALDAPDAYKFGIFRSWDVQWTIMQYDYKPKGCSQTYSVGVGLNWSNFTLKDNDTSFTKVGDVTTLGAFPAGTDDHYSSVHRLAIDIPLLFTQDFGKHVSLTLGPVVKFNTGGWLHNSYEMGDDDVNVTTKKIGLRPVTVDIMGVLDIYGVGLYCKYSPMSVYKKDRGPEFKSLTFGLYF